jgi:hypothetical protein
MRCVSADGGPSVIGLAAFAGGIKTQFVFNPHCDLTNGNGARTACRMLKMAVQRGCSERSGEAYASVR